MISEIKDMLNSPSTKNFNSLNLENLDLLDYKDLILTTLNNLEKANYPLNQINLIQVLITAIIEVKKKSEEKSELELIHYDIVLTWLSKIQTEESFDMIVGQKIVSFLIEKISVKQLNFYNEETQNSILKQLLLRYENCYLFETFYNKGLKFVKVEGVNPYYYSLINGTAKNLVTQTLYGLNIPLPKGYWSYLFNAIATKKIQSEKDFLLTLDDKEFLINKITKDTVWTCIIKNKAYDLIKYVPLDFYKPLDGKNGDLLQVMSDLKDFTLVNHLGLKTIKLLKNKEEEVVGLFSAMMKSQKNRDILIKHFLYQIVNTKKSISKLENASYIELEKEWENICYSRELNQHNIILHLIIDEYKKLGEIVSLEQENDFISNANNIDFIINIYKNKKELSENTKENILNYLNFIGDFDVNALKQSDKFYINKNLLNFNKDILSKWYFMENQKDNNISDIVFEKVLLNVDDITFQCLCEESTIYLKEFKSPQITKVVDSVFKNNLDKIDFSFDEEEDEIDENENIFIDVDSLKKDLINIEVMSGSTMQEAQSCIDASVEDLKRLSSYPKHEPRSVPVSYFLKALNNIDTEVNQQLMTEIHKELNKEMKTPEGVAAEDVVNTINTMAEIKDVEDESIKLDLFTKESFNKLVNEFEDNNNDVIKDFLKKNKNIDIVQKKTLAKASLFLENMDELYQTFPHFENVIQHIENFMILQDKGDKSFYIPPLLLGGGPGVGKTFFCNTISKLVNTPFELFNMESMTANWVLTGSSSQWRDATPGKIFRTLMNKDNLTINPIFLLDELEKSGGDSRYGVMNSLLPLLERYTAKRFKDECIPLEIDASYIVWFATANDLDKLTPPIKSRFDIFSVPNPNPTQRKSLIKGIYSAVRTNNTWGSYFNESLPDESLDILANLMAPGAARDLRKSITMACSKAIKTNSNIILPEHIERYDNGEIMPWDIVV